jgi:hypothetical protein
MTGHPTGDDDESGSDRLPTGRRPPGERPELDHLYEALGHPRRRYLCDVLLENTEWSLEDLATKTSARENGVPEQAVTDHRRERVYVSLYRVHVPKPVDGGIVAYDTATETMTPAGNTHQVLPALEGVGASPDGDQETRARGGIDDRDE